MSLFRLILATAIYVGTLAAGTCVYAQDSTARTELKRTDLTGTNNMEVISSIVEFKPGDEVQLHSHHGIESGYVLQGANIQIPGKDPTTIPTGVPILNLRDVPHGGYKVIGDTSLKLFTVHVVDKNKPLYEYTK